MKELKLLGRHIKRYWLQYVLGIIALALVDLMNVYIPQFTGEVTDGLKAGTIGMDGVWRLVGWIVLLGGGMAIGRLGWRYFIFGTSLSIQKDMQRDLFAHLEKLSMRYFNEHKTGDLMAHFTNDLQAVRMLMGPTIVTAFDATVMLIMVLGKMIFYVDMRLTLVAVIPLLLIMYGDYAYGKVMHRKFFAKQRAFSDLTDQVQEAVSGIRVIKAFVQERKELAAFARVNQLNQDRNMDVARTQALFLPLLDLIIGVSGFLTLLYGGYLTITGDITLGQFEAFNLYIAMLVWPMMAAGECITFISQGMASLKRIQVIMNEQPDIVDGPEARRTDGLQGEIHLDGLTFSYPGHEESPALDAINIHVARGSTLAVLGRTGSGKTTLANLLLRMYNTKRNMIRIDGRSLYEIPLAVLRRDIAYVPQDSFLFSDTLENNIAFGAESWDMASIQQAAKDACIHDNIMDFPENYQTMVGERGVTLSGGQKQRSAIARALLKNAPILILDDALSAVDTDTE
ncbi:MAG: ABC transporter ATP-binding protein/permease, partial [Oscillospiraceae bacterium]|nr:ABC transporter ATP-binding protein/permease [Oscillospiraceae bacterium]